MWVVRMCYYEEIRNSSKNQQQNKSIPSSPPQQTIMSIPRASTVAEVSPWRSALIAATLKRRAPGADEDDEIVETKEEETSFVDSSPYQRKIPPPVPPRKKSQMQKNFEDVVATCPTDLAQACRFVYTKLKELPHSDDDLELERVLDMLEIVNLKGVQDMEKMFDYRDRLGESVSTILEKTVKEHVAKRLEALTKKSQLLVSVFSELTKDMDNHDAYLEAFAEKFEELTRDATSAKSTAEEFLASVAKRHDELSNKCNRLDKELENMISTKSPQRATSSSRHLSLTLDVLQSGDPKILHIMQDRRHACEMQKIAMDEYDLRTKELQLKKAICALCEVAGAQLEENMNESRLRGYHNRIQPFEETFEQAREVLTQLAVFMGLFGNFQKERERNALEKLEKATEALHEHMRLYGPDEAPTERKDLEGRVAEFTEIVKRSKQALAAAVIEQVQLWSTEDLPTEVLNLAKSKLGPAIRSLPFTEEFAAKAGFFGVLVTQHEDVTNTVIPRMESKQELTVGKPHLPIDVRVNVDAWGYDSDDFLETDETSSASSSLPDRSAVPSLSTAQIDALKTSHAISTVATSSTQKPVENGGSSCVVM